jgi:hypothetical protein
MTRKTARSNLFETIGASTERRTGRGSPAISRPCGADRAISIGPIILSSRCWTWCMLNRRSAIGSVGDCEAADAIARRHLAEVDAKLRRLKARTLVRRSRE